MLLLLQSCMQSKFSPSAARPDRTMRISLVHVRYCVRTSSDSENLGSGLFLFPVAHLINSHLSPVDQSTTDRHATIARPENPSTQLHQYTHPDCHFPRAIVYQMIDLPKAGGFFVSTVTAQTRPWGKNFRKCSRTLGCASEL